MEGISKFDKTQLKKTETSEKQSLPDTEGNITILKLKWCLETYTDTCGSGSFTIPRA